MKINWHMVCWLSISFMFLISALFQCYNMGYKNAEWDCQQKIMRLQDKHTDEVVEQIKKRRAAEEALQFQLDATSSSPIKGK